MDIREELELCGTCGPDFAEWLSDGPTEMQFAQLSEQKVHNVVDESDASLEALISQHEEHVQGPS